MSTRFLLIRHAESVWNAEGRWQGHADPPLSSRGQLQAIALADRLHDESVHLLVASDLRRAVETAEAVAPALGARIVADPRLRELDVGSWTGLHREEIEEADPEALARFDAGDPTLRAGGAESRAGIRLRARDVIEDLCQRHPGALVALVTHLGFVRALLPGAEPGNADVLRADGRELLAARRVVAAAPPAGAL